MLSSNFRRWDHIQFYVDLIDYSAEELVQIFRKYAESRYYHRFGFLLG